MGYLIPQNLLCIDISLIGLQGSTPSLLLLCHENQFKTGSILVSPMDRCEATTLPTFHWPLLLQAFTVRLILHECSQTAPDTFVAASYLSSDCILQGLTLHSIDALWKWATHPRGDAVLYRRLFPRHQQLIPISPFRIGSAIDSISTWEMLSLLNSTGRSLLVMTSSGGPDGPSGGGPSGPEKRRIPVELCAEDESTIYCARTQCISAEYSRCGSFLAISANRSTCWTYSSYFEDEKERTKSSIPMVWWTSSIMLIGAFGCAPGNNFPRWTTK